jgi:hypothetical protein
MKKSLSDSLLAAPHGVEHPVGKVEPGAGGQVRRVRPRVKETQVRQLHVHNAGHPLLNAAMHVDLCQRDSKRGMLLL